MEHKQRSQGFSSVWLLVAGILILGGGLSGYLVMRTHDSKTAHKTEPANTSLKKTSDPPKTSKPAAQKQPTSTGGSTSSTPNSTVKTATYKIPELGIQFALPASLAGLKYITDTTTIPGETQVKFTTSDLQALDGAQSQCTATEAALGVMWIDTQSPSASGAQANAYKQVGSKYVLYQRPQGGCSNVTATLNLQVSQRTLLEGAVPTATTP